MRRFRHCRRSTGHAPSRRLAQDADCTEEHPARRGRRRTSANALMVLFPSVFVRVIRVQGIPPSAQAAMEAVPAELSAPTLSVPVLRRGQPHPRHQHRWDLAVVSTPRKRLAAPGMARRKGALLQPIQHEPDLKARPQQCLQWPMEVELWPGLGHTETLLTEVTVLSSRLIQGCRSQPTRTGAWLHTCPARCSHRKRAGPGSRPTGCCHPA